MRYVLVFFILSSISGFAQDIVTFKDGEFFLKGEQITVNEFNVLLENQGLMTPYKKRLMDVSQDRIWNAKRIRRSYQIIAGVYYTYGLFWLSQSPWNEGPNEAFGVGTVSLGISFIDFKKRSYRVYSKMVEEYNSSLLEHSNEATIE